jgi:hypothetical protein
MLSYSAINSSGWPIRNQSGLLVPMAATFVLLVLASMLPIRQPAAARMLPSRQP